MKEPKYKQSRKSSLGALARFFGVGGTAKKIKKRDIKSTEAGKKARKSYSRKSY